MLLIRLTCASNWRFPCLTLVGGICNWNNSRSDFIPEESIIFKKKSSLTYIWTSGIWTYTLFMTLLCSYIFLVLRDRPFHGLYVVYIWKQSYAHALVGRQWCGIFHCDCWTSSIKPRLLFSPCRLCFSGPFFLSDKFNYQYCGSQTHRHR